MNCILLIAVLEVITEQKEEDLEKLYKICRNEYEKFRSRSEYKNSKYHVHDSIFKYFIHNYFDYFTNPE
jgi:hypothetical protein